MFKINLLWDASHHATEIKKRLHLLIAKKKPSDERVQQKAKKIIDAIKTVLTKKNIVKRYIFYLAHNKVLEKGKKIVATLNR